MVKVPLIDLTVFTHYHNQVYYSGSTVVRGVAQNTHIDRISYSSSATGSVGKAGTLLE